MIISVGNKIGSERMKGIEVKKGGRDEKKKGVCGRKDERS